MKNTVEILGTTLVATVLLIVAQLVMRPAPVRGMLVSIPILAIAIRVVGRRRGETASP